ncbi:uncharacterized protein LOC121109418 [Gallus gallus]|uniref:uncharacterized protein LOC121109418 n=1 Tax=Gallus gallus TaxID=9031 RepID=UPI001AE6FD33|nr:uncharacterized protein LOC121109418 [Gallus gallus]
MQLASAGGCEQETPEAAQQREALRSGEAVGRMTATTDVNEEQPAEKKERMWGEECPPAEEGTPSTVCSIAKVALLFFRV